MIYAFTWQYGRRLSSISHNGDSISYTYDPDGIRTSKTVNGTTTKYHVMNGTLLGQTKGSDTIVFLYDEKANRYGFDYNGTKYYYIFNVQGDVIGILNQAGQKIVSYTYDPWGKVLSVDGSEASAIGQLNPIRYRGYYYDTETGFYYLQSRYYDPVTRRFLNADIVVDNGVGILGTNMFAYCINNPVNMFDNSGVSPEYINEQYNDTLLKINGEYQRMENIQWGIWGNIANNGCGVIATYNVILSKNPEIDFGEIRDEMWQSNTPLFQGAFGVNPFYLEQYLHTRYAAVLTALDSNLGAWGKTVAAAESVIVLYQLPNTLAMHYISGIRVGGKWATFRFYNVSSNYDDLKFYSQPISIYRLADRLISQGKTLRYLYGIL